MAEYAVAVRRHFGRFPRQFVLYVGQAELRMRPELFGLQFRSYYELIDLRQIEAEQLLDCARSARTHHPTASGAAFAGVTTIGVTLRIKRSGRLRPVVSTAETDFN